MPIDSTTESLSTWRFVSRYRVWNTNAGGTALFCEGITVAEGRSCPQDVKWDV